ncbi:MAG: hypothetical protein H8Z69_00600 [Nanohaloarchaea archaeon]|nr:hypothetical protein [Candidatus Nanohaloarchaea archaeon]
MELSTIDKEGRIIIDMQQNHTLGNLIRKAVWAQNEEAAYDKGHPLGDESNLIIESDEPEEVLEDAIEQAREWMDGVESAF